MWIKTRKSSIRIWPIVALLILALFANSAAAQTPEGQTDPPAPTVALTEVPVATDVPTETTVPTELPPATVEETPTTTDTPVSTETPSNPDPTAVPATPTATTVPTEAPTATEEVIVPDILQVDSGTTVSIGPGESRDVAITYTLGSNRYHTQLTATLSAPGVDLTGWSITPVNRADQLNDPADPARNLKARVDVSEANSNGATFTETLRVVAPSHLETVQAVNIDFQSTIVRSDGNAAGVNMTALVVVNASASAHNPTVVCEPVATTNQPSISDCSYTTTHPETNVTVAASATAPQGWELSLDGSPLSASPTVISSASAPTVDFTVAADYPVGCPAMGASESATITLQMTYPSGEVKSVSTSLPLTFHEPDTTVSVESFSFNEMNSLSSLSTTGELKLKYTNAPCAWQLTITFGDLVTDSTTINDAVFSVVAVDGLPNASVISTGDTVVISAPDSTTTTDSGVITISLNLTLQNPVPPGNYLLRVTTELLTRESW